MARRLPGVEPCLVFRATQGDEKILKYAFTTDGQNLFPASQGQHECRRKRLDANITERQNIMEQFIKLFGKITVADIVLLVCAVVFLAGIFRTVKKIF